MQRIIIHDVDKMHQNRANRLIDSKLRSKGTCFTMCFVNNKSRAWFSHENLSRREVLVKSLENYFFKERRGNQNHTSLSVRMSNENSVVKMFFSLAAETSCNQDNFILWMQDNNWLEWFSIRCTPIFPFPVTATIKTKRFDKYAAIKWFNV